MNFTQRANNVFLALALFSGFSLFCATKSVCADDAAPVTDTAAAHEKWKNLSPEQKKQLLENYQRWKKLPEDKKNTIRSAYDHYRTLSPEAERPENELRPL